MSLIHGSQAGTPEEIVRLAETQRQRAEELISIDIPSPVIVLPTPPAVGEDRLEHLRRRDRDAFHRTLSRVFFLNAE